MPRAGWKKPESDLRLPDMVSVGLLMKVFPPRVVDEVVAECGRTEQRRRSLPARSMVYFAMGMALHSDGSYEDVLALISDGLAWAERGEGSGRLANKAAISHARDRLGPAPTARLFERVAVPLATADTPGAWLAGRRLVAIDGTCLDLPDTVANDAHFGSVKDRRREHPVTVRVIEYSIADGRENEDRYRLITTVLDPEQAPALELAAAYSQRWELESAFDELKTHQRGPRAVLRSKSPDLVIQEIWGHLCCHYAIRTLMADAAEHAGHDPDRVSFVAALRIARRSIAQQGAFPPQVRDVIALLWAHAIGELSRRLLPRRLPRANPRVVKRKYTKWHVKRDAHRNWPQPDCHSADAVVI